MTAPVVGIVGAGQLARMTAQAAISLAIDVRVLARRPDDPACGAATAFEIGDPADIDALLRFAGSCDVVTFDHEQVAPTLVAELESRGIRILPGSEVLHYSDKAHQRVRLSSEGMPVPDFALVSAAAGIDAFARAHGWPVVVKSATGGYDGRGVFVVEGPADAASTAALLTGQQIVVEPMLAIDAEIAVVVARRPSGPMVAYPVVETTQVDGICVETATPARISDALATEATALACRLAESIGAVGILAVEFFVVGGKLIVNELAPRPHNSGHWTIEGAATSQFENHLRAVLDWPLGSTEPTAPAVAMANVLGPPDGGDPIDAMRDALEIESLSVHLYGKEARPGRKLGHVTARGADREEVTERVRAGAAVLGRTARGAAERVGAT